MEKGPASGLAPQIPLFMFCLRRKYCVKPITNTFYFINQLNLKF